MDEEFAQGGLAVTVYNGRVSGAVSGTVSELLGYIQAHPGLRANELSLALKIPLRTTQRWLKQLKVADQIEFIGAPKTGGYYFKVTPKGWGE